MNQGKDCPREGEVLQAVRTGIWQQAISAHVNDCAVCREVVQVAQSVRSLAASAEGTLAMPEAHLIWLRSQFSDRQAKEERVWKILDWTEFILAVLVPAVLAGWIGLNWTVLQTLLTSRMAETWRYIWNSTSNAAGTGPTAISLGLVIFSLFSILIVYPLLARD
jgi:hypothetical protein